MHKSCLALRHPLMGSSERVVKAPAARFPFLLHFCSRFQPLLPSQPVTTISDSTISKEIRWIETFPIVRGVGNLILNLGFNQSAFLVTSFLDGLLPNRIGLWLVGGFLPWLGLTLSAYAAVRLMAARKVRRSPLEIAYAISLPAWIYTLLGNNISSGSPDVTSSCLLIHLFLTFAAFVMTADHLERARLFGDLWILSAICVCLKLNTLGMVVGICFMAVLFLILKRDSCWAGRSYLRWSGAVTACLLGFWVYRGVLLSGYPLFPSGIAAVPVAWQIPPSQVEQCREDTVYWARIPYGDRKVALEGLSWGRSVDSASRFSGRSIRLAARHRLDQLGGRAAALVDGKAIAASQILPALSFGAAACAYHLLDLDSAGAPVTLDRPRGFSPSRQSSASSPPRNRSPSSASSPIFTCALCRWPASWLMLRGNGRSQTPDFLRFLARTWPSARTPLGCAIMHRSKEIKALIMRYLVPTGPSRISDC